MFTSSHSLVVYSVRHKVLTVKEKKGTLGYIKCKRLCSWKDTTKNILKGAKEWEEIFAVHITNKVHQNIF